jgi:hypothetical protein
MNLWMIGLATRKIFFVPGQDISEALKNATDVVPMDSIGMVSYHSAMPKLDEPERVTMTIENPGKDILP